MKHPDAVIFDLDGTLYSLRGFGPRIMLRSLARLKLMSGMLNVRRMMKGKDGRNSEALYRELFSNIHHETGHDVSAIESWYFNTFYPDFIGILNKMKRRTRLDRLLQSLRTQGIALAVFSDYGYVLERLEALDIDPEQFDVIASSEEYGALKPAVRPFLEVASLLSVSPEKTLLVGDREDTDGAGAASAGMSFVKVSDNSWGAFIDLHLREE